VRFQHFIHEEAEKRLSVDPVLRIAEWPSLGNSLHFPTVKQTHGKQDFGAHDGEHERHYQDFLCVCAKRHGRTIRMDAATEKKFVSVD
jgi:hypothetical protein